MFRIRQITTKLVPHVIEDLGGGGQCGGEKPLVVNNCKSVDSKSCFRPDHMTLSFPFLKKINSKTQGASKMYCREFPGSSIDNLAQNSQNKRATTAFVVARSFTNYFTGVGNTSLSFTIRVLYCV